jgi:hypothetical protein
MCYCGYVLQQAGFQRSPIFVYGERCLRTIYISKNVTIRSLCEDRVRIYN